MEIHLSNRHLADTVTILAQSGHATVPAGEALLTLFSPFPAFGGALFFACTAGTVVTISAIVCYVVCYYFFDRAKHRIIICYAVWLIITVLLTFTGENPATMAYTLSIPLIIICIMETKGVKICADTDRGNLLSGRRNVLNGRVQAQQIKKRVAKDSGSSGSTDQKRPISSPLTITWSWTGMVIIFISMLITTSIYYFRCDKEFFLRARDYLLVTNRPGRLLNDFYYNHTPYAAEVITPPLHRQVKTCWIDPELPRFSKMKKALSRYGWLAIETEGKALLTVNSLPLMSGEERIILLNNPPKVVCSVKNIFFPAEMEIKLKDFLKKPFHFLNNFSQLCDAHTVMRMLCLIGLIALTPLLLYLGFFLMIACCIRMVILQIYCIIRKSSIPRNSYSRIPVMTTAIIMVILSSVLVNTLYPPDMEKENMEISNMLTHADGMIRIEALRKICNNGNDNIWHYFHGKKTLHSALNSENIAEKYWLAKALGIAGEQRAVPYLETLSKDPSPNVQCIAMGALANIAKNIIAAKQGGEHTKSQTTNSPYWKQGDNLSRIHTILEKKRIYTHQWYVQQYAYEALQKIKLR